MYESRKVRCFPHLRGITGRSEKFIQMNGIRLLDQQLLIVYGISMKRYQELLWSAAGKSNCRMKYDFKDLMAFGMFILALLTFIFYNCK